jgi:diketogulonate reductase-like aldo/keto reductase
MTKRRFGPMPDKVPIVGQGTWQMAERRRDAAEIAALRAGIARGLTHIDTAELYGSGAAEELIAEAIRGIPRRDLFLVSKVLPSNASRAGTQRACERSLKRLGVDYLDVYLLHWRGSFPLADTLGALEDLVDQGKIRALGVSNFDVADLEEARSLLRKAPIVCNQVLYHLGERHIDAELVPYCAQHDIAVVGYSPFGHGRFPSPTRASGQVLASVAARHGATPRQVALAFLARAAPLFTIPKASTVAHVEENAGALALTLDANEIAEIDAAFPARPADSLPII